MSQQTLDLENAEHKTLVNAQWRYADGLVPGEPNGGLVDQLAETPAEDREAPRNGHEPPFVGYAHHEGR